MPVTITEAYRFVDTHHRHHQAPVGALFAVGVARGEKKEYVKEGHWNVRTKTPQEVVSEV